MSRTILVRGASIGAVRVERILSGRDPLDLRPLDAVRFPCDADSGQIVDACAYVCAMRAARKHFGKAWLLYCLVGGAYPHAEDFGVSEGSAREIEREIANRFFIADPVNGFADAEMLRRVRRAPRKVRRGCTEMEREHLARIRRQNGRSAMAAQRASERVPF